MSTKRETDYRYVFVLSDGETIMCDHRDARRTIDIRSEGGDPEVCWLITLSHGGFRRVWVDEIVEWHQEDVD